MNKHREAFVSNTGIGLLLWIYRTCGQRVCRAVVACIVLFAYPFLRRGRKTTAAFLRQWRAHNGKRACSPFRNILTFAYTLADRLACRAGLLDMRNVNVCTPDEYQQLTSLYLRGCGSFCLVSHLGCFDMLRVMFDCTRKDMRGEIHVFMDSMATRNFSEQQLKYGGEKLEMYAHSVQDMSPALSMQMVEKLEQGAMMVMAGDRVWRDEESANYTFNFLGKEARFPRGCFRWAAIMGCPVYFICLAEHEGRYDLHVKCLSNGTATQARTLAEQYAATLENFTEQYPSNWFNFYNFWK